MKCIVQDDELVILLEGSERLWALKSRITIQRSDVQCAWYTPQFTDWRRWEIRLPGTGWPGVLVAGSFWTEQGWDFLYLPTLKGWRNPIAYNVLVIETLLQRYRRILVSCSPEDATEVLAWARK